MADSGLGGVCTIRIARTAAENKLTENNMIATEHQD